MAKAAAERRAAWRAGYGSEAPEDMVYGSGSGLDPAISLEAALSQLPAVAAARGLDAAAGAAREARIRAMAAASTTLLGPPRVNVVSLNADLGY